MKQKPVPIDLFTRLKYPSGLVADGAGRLCFALKTIDLAKNRSRSALWLMEGDGPARQLLPPAVLRGHWWAGPGKLLLAKGGGKKETAWQADGLPFTLLETLDATDPAARPKRLARLFLEVEDAAALPGGDFILLARWDPAAEAALAQAGGNAEKAAARLKEDAVCQVLEELPFWENGRGFTGKKRRRLYLLRGGKTLPLTGEATEVEQFRLSPSGRSLWYTARQFSGVAPIENRLFRLTLDEDILKPNKNRSGSPPPAAEELTLGKMSHGAVVPLSDTTALVAASDMRRHGLNQNPAFYRLQATPGAKPAATKLYGGGRYDQGNSVNTDVAQSAGTRWQPVGDEVLWTTTLGGDAHLMGIHPGTGAIRQITKAAGAVHELALHRGEVVISALRGQKAPELYALAAGGTERQLTHFNDEICDKYAFTAPIPLAAHSGTNEKGRKVQGWVLPPAGGFKADGPRCPAILCIHGGPKTVYGTVLHHEMQFLAAQGYAVVFCNPMGSDGGGDKFADIRGVWGGPDYDDLMAFLDAALAAHPEIDPARLGACGGSYGGFMVNWIIGHTGRFAAAVSQRGIANWVSMAAISDIGYYFVPSEQGATIWQDEPTLWQQSPMRYADQVKTPTLIIHSDADYRCPPAEGLQMYAALKEHGVPMRMCLFGGENHELSRSGQPKARLRRLREICDWFGQYLK